MSTQRQIAANRKNAQKSTGPKTPQGRAAVARNALKHGLTARQAVIETESQAEFNKILRFFQHDLQPVGSLETSLVQQIVGAHWRLRRARQLETDFFDVRMDYFDGRGYDDYLAVAKSARPAYVVRDDLLNAGTHPHLSRYEARIERSFYRALHELERLQARRAGQHVPPPVTGDISLGISEDEPRSQSPSGLEH